jgi:hypothetical protein
MNEIHADAVNDCALELRPAQPSADPETVSDREDWFCTSSVRTYSCAFTYPVLARCSNHKNE